MGFETQEAQNGINVDKRTLQKTPLYPICWIGMTKCMKKISEMLFELGQMKESIHEFMKPKDKKRHTILTDATDIFYS